MPDMPYVLLVEDDTSTRRLVRDILEDEVGVVVVEANDGAKALHTLAEAEHAPGLLLVDLMLPNMDGETFMTEVRRLYGPDLPIIVMSAMDPKLVRSSAEQVGAQRVVLKPFNVADLVANVQDALQLGSMPPAPGTIVDLEEVRQRKAGTTKGLSRPSDSNREPPRKQHF
jgi:CheY-like chemotaxis protein